MLEQEYGSYMARAIALAEKGRFHTYPNPAVGALLVRDGQIVAEGWHKAAGQEHAEIVCLNEARARGIDPAGATMVVTLEPCRHQGKTPPCVQAILDAGIARLVYGTADPNPEAAGGAAMLAEAGVEVAGPVLERECQDLIADFKVWRESSRPYVLLKLASTLDGRIATRNGHSQWISTEGSRRKVHELRAGMGASGGAMLIGGGTFRSDNPQLSSRVGEAAAGPQPLACILTSRLPKADAAFHLLREEPERTIFFASPAAAASTTAEALRKLGCRVLALGPTAQGALNFTSMFKILRQDLGCPYVLCEGGGHLALSLLEAGFVDEFHMHLAPIILGDNDAKPLFTGRAPLSLDEAIHMRVHSSEMGDGDIRVVFRPEGGVRGRP